MLPNQFVTLPDRPVVRAGWLNPTESSPSPLAELPDVLTAATPPALTPALIEAVWRLNQWLQTSTPSSSN